MKKQGIMNGRALFAYKPELFKDDENAGGAETFQKEESKEVEESKVDTNLFAQENADDEEVDFD